jgi:hypothetical protein
MPLYLESYFKDEPHKANCSYITPQRTLLDYEVCGTEEVYVEGGMKQPLLFNYTKYQDADAHLNLATFRLMFSINSTSCNFTRWELRDVPGRSLSVTGATVWSQFIKINDRKNTLDIKHNTAPAMTNNTKFDIYFVGITQGKVEAYKKMEFTFWNNQVDRAAMIQEIAVDTTSSDSSTSAADSSAPGSGVVTPATTPTGFEVEEEE